jgi:hypothetical protein
MNGSLHFASHGMLVVLGLLAATLCLLEVGRWLGARRRAQDPEGAKAGAGAVDGAVFGLMGLLIAFTFSGAATRFDARRALAVEEANCIGTAWLRLDLLPVAGQPGLREKFRQYVAARLAVFRAIPDLAASKAEQKRAGALQTEIWTGAVAACRDSGSSSATMLLLPALNQMFDISTTRTVGAQMHPPVIIYGMLFLLVLAGSLLAGYGMALGKARDWFHAFAFVVVIVLAIYVILDFEFPRVGLIRIHDVDRVLVELQESMNAATP